MHRFRALSMTHIAAQQPGYRRADTAGDGPLQDLKDGLEHLPLVFVLCCRMGALNKLDLLQPLLDVETGTCLRRQFIVADNLGRGVLTVEGLDIALQRFLLG